MKEFEETVKFLTELKNDPYELTRIRLEIACERVNRNRIFKPKSTFEFLNNQPKEKQNVWNGRGVVDVDVFCGDAYSLDICDYRYSEKSVQREQRQNHMVVSRVVSPSNRTNCLSALWHKSKDIKEYFKKL